MTTWLVIGSSPSVLQTLTPVATALHRQSPQPVTITCNSGIKLWPRPDYYVAVDQRASVYFAEQARRAQEQGTQLVTIQRGEKAQRDRKIDHYDHFLETGGYPTRNEYGSFAYSGPLCVEFACHQGATEIHLVGMDGYKPGRDDDHFDTGTVPRTKSADSYTLCVLEHIQPRLTKLAEVWWEVEFVQYGQPVYRVDCPNWTVADEVTA